MNQGEPSPADPPAEGEVTTPQSAVVAASVGFGVTALLGGLRFGGLMDGVIPVVILLVLVPLLLPRPRRLADRVLVVLMISLGWMPLLGWLPSALTSLDLAGIALALVVGLSTAFRLGASRSAILDIGDLTLVVPLLAAISITNLWIGSLAKGSSSRMLGLLMQGWDHVAHAAFYWRIIDLGSFPAVSRRSPAGDLWHGWDYPQGVHYAAALGHQLYAASLPLTPDARLRSYANAVAVGMGATTLVVGLAVARLPRKSSGAAVIAFPTTVVVMAYFALGPGVMAVTFGFPNFFISIAAGLVVASVSLRSTGSSWADITIAGGAVMLAAYNWFPVLVFVAPLALSLGLRLLGELGWRRVTALAVPMVAAAVAPIAITLGLGVEVLNVNGGISPTSRATLALGLSLYGVAAYLTASTHGRSSAVALAASAAVTAAFIGAVGWSQIRATGSLPYYFDKISLAGALVGVAVFAMAMTMKVEHVADNRGLLDRGRPRWLTIAPIALLLGIAASQSSGYFGPRWTLVAPSTTAPGLVMTTAFAVDPQPYTGAGERVIAVAEQASRVDASMPTMSLLTAPDAPLPLLQDFWVAALTNRWDSGRQARANALATIDPHLPIAEQVAILRSSLPVSDDSSIALLTSAEVAAVIEANEPGAPFDLQVVPSP